MKRYRMSEGFRLNFSAEDLTPPEHRPMKSPLDSEATYDAVSKKLYEARNLLRLSHDTIFRLMDNQDITARELVTKIRLWLSKDMGE